MTDGGCGDAVDDPTGDAAELDVPVPVCGPQSASATVHRRPGSPAGRSSPPEQPAGPDADRGGRLPGQPPGQPVSASPRRTPTGHSTGWTGRPTGRGRSATVRTAPPRGQRADPVSPSMAGSHEDDADLLAGPAVGRDLSRGPCRRAGLAVALVRLWPAPADYLPSRHGAARGRLRRRRS
jgi:hypothetical protein